MKAHGCSSSANKRAAAPPPYLPAISGTVLAFFRCCGLTGSVTFGKNVTNIGNNAFVGCFTKAYFTGGVPEIFDDSAFRSCLEDFAICCIDGNEGWSTSEWKGYPCYPIDKLPGTAAPGDVNGDDALTAADRLILTRYLAEWDGYGKWFE